MMNVSRLTTSRQIKWAKALAAIGVLTLALPALAVKMDETTHDQVIQRLEIGLSSMEASDSDRTPIALRLAELYADRARLRAMSEVEQNCGDNCKGAQSDRTKAIALYNECLPKAPQERQGRLLLQLAHLHALNNEGEQSQKLYQKIIKAKPSAYASDVRAIAFSSVADVYFKQGNFKTALEYFLKSKRERLHNKALVEFRLAWCHLNLGNTQKAIQILVGLLKNPAMLKTQTTDGQNVDPSFVQDLTRDLARFLARTDVKPRDIEMLKSFSPDKIRKENLYTLAIETDRLGKKSASLLVLASYVDEPDVQANEKLEVQIRVAKIYYDMNKHTLAAQAFAKAMDLWRATGCQNNDDLCEELKSRARKMVTAWNKGQKTKPTSDLFNVYLAYTQTFTDDLEMFHWGAVVGREIDRPGPAAKLFHTAALLSAAELKKKDDKTIRNIFEGSLLGEIEMAESSKDKKAQESAYDFYLDINPNGTEAVRVRYQRAQLYYATHRTQQAFSEFHYLATMPIKENRDLRLKSADLALDSLVALKDDESLQVRSLEYARHFPERKPEYLKISRKATLTIVANNLKNQSQHDTAAYKANLLILNKVSLEGADEQEKIRFLKNKLIVAQRALELEAVQETADQLLRINKISPEDREWSLAQKVWASEIQLDFTKAYRLSLTMKLPHLTAADRQLRLALLANLAGLNARKHHEEYLRVNKSLRSGNLVRVTMIRESRQPWQELDKHLKSLKQTPDLLAGIAVEVFARKPDFKRAERLLGATPAITRYAAGQTLQRHVQLKELQKFDSQIRSHQILGYNDRVMQRSVKERLKLIGQSERFAQRAIQQKDWTLQLFQMAQVAREYRRLYDDLMRLPVPRQLKSAEDRAKYQEALKAQSAPYMARAERIEGDLNGTWQQSNSLQSLQAAYMTATPEMQNLYKREIESLAKFAPPHAKNRLHDLLNTPYRRPSQRDILMARKDYQANPMSIEKAEALRNLEAQNGRISMVVYLDERISQLKKGKSL